ncbi:MULTISPECIES: transporter [Brucella/Ochrobactrum group]|uniref:transporter n=1 Tax=Brucella/Ochrobactrum group TaxID=2826938 RepID=UPI002165CAD8|nr:transporter [Brucella anthropi]UVV70974.1 transporter [Brucella anthropi]
MLLFRKMSIAGLLMSTIALSFVPNGAYAGNFLGNAQPGTPGWALQLWPYYTKENSSQTAANFFQLAWFSETGLTGTKQDQVELWLGFNGGYQKSDFEGDDSRWGVTSPQLGFEYYYQVAATKAKPNTEGYRAWWISPTIFMNFPNGSDKSSGYGAGANQYSISASVNNFFGYDKWQLSISPANINYLFRDKNYTDLETGGRKRMQAGLSLNLADIAFGYQLTDTLAVGVHHQYDIYNLTDSDYARSERGRVGPTFTYSGLADKGYWISGTLDFDYSNRNTERATTFSAFIGKSL